MTFADQLRAVSGSLTARQIAHVTDYSARTVENWLQNREGRAAPHPRHRPDILRAVKRAAKAKTENSQQHE